MKFSLYQINLTERQYKMAGVRDLYLDTTLFPTPKAIGQARNLYKKVAEIDAVSFDHVFEIGNIGPYDKIERFSPMHSVSVGDVIVREDGVTKFVAPHSFEALVRF